MDASKTVFLFPGQGSQQVGMGFELAQKNEHAAAVFQSADRLLGFSLSNLCWHGPEEGLNETINTQPALFTHSIAVLKALQAHRPGFQPAFCAGHSLGQLTALVASGSLDFEHGLQLVRARGEAMRRAGEQLPGGMAAVLGLDLKQVETACEQAYDQSGETVQVANDNCPGQVVISGTDAALALAIEHLKEAGARRVLRLAVSIAAHSALMEPAQQDFNRALVATPMTEPIIPIIGNVSAGLLESLDAIRADLMAQLTARVRWTESIQALIEFGMDTFIEIGAGDVLTKLMRRIDREAAALSLDDPQGLDPLFS